jgi:imidazolonepropionase-like amidohydrolase
MRKTRLDEERAIKAITENPAAILGLEKRLGKLEVGFDADVVIWKSHPLDVRSLPEQVYVDVTASFKGLYNGYYFQYVRINMNGKFFPGQKVLVENGKINMVGSSIFKNVENVIECEQRYLVPA